MTRLESHPRNQRLATVTGKRYITDIYTRQTLDRLALKSDRRQISSTFEYFRTTLLLEIEQEFGWLEYQVILPSKLRICTLESTSSLVQWADLDFVTSKPLTSARNDKETYVDSRGSGDGDNDGDNDGDDIVDNDGKAASAVSVLELGQKRGKAKVVCGVNCRGTTEDGS